MSTLEKELRVILRSRGARPFKDPPTNVQALPRCVEVLEQIAGILDRADLPNAAKWQRLCIAYLKRSKDTR